MVSAKPEVPKEEQEDIRSSHHLLLHRSGSKPIARHLIENVTYFHGFVDSYDKLLKGKPPGSYIACNSPSEPSIGIDIVSVAPSGRYTTSKVFKHGSHIYSKTKVLSPSDVTFSSLTDLIRSEPEVYKFAVRLSDDKSDEEEF